MMAHWLSAGQRGLQPYIEAKMLHKAQHNTIRSNASYHMLEAHQRPGRPTSLCANAATRTDSRQAAKTKVYSLTEMK